MRYFTVFVLFNFFISFASIAQHKPNRESKAVFEVLDAETHQKLADIQVHSLTHLNREDAIKTDINGKITLHVIEQDTLSFVGALHYPVHIVIHKENNFDWTHPIQVYLTPLIHHSHKEKIHGFEPSHTSMSSLDYHFTHHEFDSKVLKIQVLEHQSAAGKRAKWLQTTRDKYNKGFNIVDIKFTKRKK